MDIYSVIKRTKQRYEDMDKKKTKEEKQAFVRDRREKREQCFAVLFEMTFSDESIDTILDKAVESRLIETDEFMMNILHCFEQNKSEIDSLIESNLKKWTLNRLSRTTRSILRCAVAEVKAVKTPASIVINESVEIAKKYSTEQDAAFINGVLGAMSRNGGI